MKKFEYTYKALATICSITIIRENDVWLNKIINHCYDITTRFENEFSRFKSDSTLSKLNTNKKQEVSDDFLTLIYKSRDIYKMTQGYFNPLIDVRKIGYSHSFTDGNFEVLDVQEDLNFDNVKNYWSLLEIDTNMNIDLWSIAKWYLAEKISRYLVEKGYKNNLCNMWGDIYASWHNLEWKKWQIAITSPFWVIEPAAVVEVSNNSVSTSGTYLRNWEVWGKKVHHIRNPYSDEVESELVSVTIISNTWYMSDALATAVIAMGRQKAIDFCEKNNIKYLFVISNGDIVQN